MKTDKKIFLVSRCSWTLYNFRANLMRTLVKMGYSVQGGGASGDGFANKINDIGVKFKELPVDEKGINPVADLKLIQAIYRWYRNEKPDIVHHFTIKPVIYGSLMAKLAGVPKIVNTITGLGYVFIDQRAHWLRRIVEKLYRLALHSSDYTFFQNQEDLEYFVQNKIVQKKYAGKVPGSGVNCEYFRPIEQYRKPEKGAQKFLFIGRLLKDKGVYEFVEAAKSVKQVYPKCKFNLLGRRDIRNPNVIREDEIKKWSEKGIVRWLGEVEDVRPIISESDSVILPSYREGLPRAMLEGAAMGKPVITTDVIGCRDVIESGITGILVPAKDSQELAKAMKILIENPDLGVKMGMKGREKVVREFDEKIVIEKAMQKYST